MTNIENLRDCSVDSMNIRIPLHELTSYDHSLEANKITIDEDTAEVEKKFKLTSKRYDQGSYSFKASLINTTLEGGVRADCIAIGIHSKLLESRYFEGLTEHNIHLVHSKLVELKIIECSLDTFISQSRTSDTDFKKDFPCQMDNYKEMISGCKEMTKESKRDNGGMRPFTKPSNYGIQWGGNRNTTDWKTFPFTKIYHKSLQLSIPKEVNGALEFAQQFLQHLDYNDIIRVETTVKNKEHFERLQLGLKSFMLKDILALTKEQKDKIMASAVNKHLTRNLHKVFSKQSDLTPTMKVYLASLLHMTQTLDYSFKNALSIFLSMLENKKEKYRVKKVITRIYEDYIFKTNYEMKAQLIEDIYTDIGLR